MNTYKDQFTEWSPAYPVVFHKFREEVAAAMFGCNPSAKTLTLHTHNITIKAINKAMKK